MEDKRTISVCKLAALERAKALGLQPKSMEMSSFERKAREWKQREQEERSELSSEKPEAGTKIQDPASSIKQGFDWQPYRAEQGDAENKPKDLNAASIALTARQIMAREWAMALGGRSSGNEEANIERKAEEYREKKAAEKERKKIEQQRAHKQRAALEETLRVFGRNLLKAPKSVSPEAAEALLEEALSEVGDTIRMTWQPDGCHILIEPWEERRLRRKTGETAPAVFQATIDDNLMLSSFQRVEDPQVLQQTRNDIILKDILLSFRNSAGEDLRAFEDAIAEEGRIIQSMKMDGGWGLELEPWEEMRRRNVERKGQPPIVTYVINADKDFNHISCERV